MAGNDIREAAARVFGLLTEEERRKRRLTTMMHRLREHGWADARPGRPAQGPTIADAAQAIEARLTAGDALRAEAERQLGPAVDNDDFTQRIGENGIGSVTGGGAANVQDAYPIPPQKPQAPMPSPPPVPPLKPAFDPLKGWPDTQPPLASAVIRAEVIQDGKYGYGTFGASRSGGTRPPHKGIDLATAAGTPVYSPINGTIAAIGEAYKKENMGLATIHVRSDDGHVIKIFYVAPVDGLKVGQGVTAGTLLGISQSLQKKHPILDDGSKMTDHVHFEFHDSNGRLVDPTPWVDRWRKQADNWWRMGGRKEMFDHD